MAIKSHFLAQFDGIGGLGNMTVSVNGNNVPQRSRAEFEQWLTAQPGRQAAYEKAKAEMKAAQERAKAAEIQAALQKARAKKSFWDIEWDGDSDCFSSLEYSHSAGGVFAQFANKTRMEVFYPMSRRDAREWLLENGDAPGEFFNDEIR